MMLIAYRTPVYFYIIYRQILTIIFHTNLLIIFGTLRDINLSSHMKDFHIFPIPDFQDDVHKKETGRMLGINTGNPEADSEAGMWLMALIGTLAAAVPVAFLSPGLGKAD